jgi:hypothetical protein
MALMIFINYILIDFHGSYLYSHTSILIAMLVRT